MKTFYDEFKDHIDMTNGTVQIDKARFEAIQLEAYKDGMTFAAQIVDEARSGDDTDLRCVRSRIETARDGFIL